MLVNSVAPVALVAYQYAHIASLTLPTCLTDHYYGLFGGHAIFKPTEHTCVHDTGDFFTPVPPIHVSYEHHKLTRANQGHLVWIQESAIDASLQTPEYEAEVEEFIKWLHTANLVAPLTSEYQNVFLEPQSGAGNQLIVLSEPGRDSPGLLLASVPSEEIALAFSSILPRYWTSSLIPSTPLSYLPVPDSAVQRVRDILSDVRFNPVVASIVNGISIDGMRHDIRYLTNEDGKSGINSRHAFAPGAGVAAAWLKENFEKTGAECELRPFLPGFAPNVVCKYAAVKDADTAPTVLISAHYDSRGSFGSSRAPGANDDGSGTISLLAIARRIKEVGVKFHSNVELVAFCGEEQGLLGSGAYARELRQQGADLTLMIQADMLAYHAPNEPPQLGLPMYIGTSEVADLVTKMATLYSPELTVGYTAACCSDHQSFHQQGFPATQVFERAGPIADPMYHNSGDLSERPGYDLHQVRYISRVQFSTLLHAAGFELPDTDDY